MSNDNVMPKHPPAGGHAPMGVGTHDADEGPNGADIGREPAEDDDAAPTVERPGDPGGTLGTGGAREQEA